MYAIAVTYISHAFLQDLLGAFGVDLICPLHAEFIDAGKIIARQGLLTSCYGNERYC